MSEPRLERLARLRKLLIEARLKLLQAHEMIDMFSDEARMRLLDMYVTLGIWEQENTRAEPVTAAYAKRKGKKA